MRFWRDKRRERVQDALFNKALVVATDRRNSEYVRHSAFRCLEISMKRDTSIDELMFHYGWVSAMHELSKVKE